MCNDFLEANFVSVMIILKSHIVVMVGKAGTEGYSSQPAQQSMAQSQKGKGNSRERKEEKAVIIKIVEVNRHRVEKTLPPLLSISSFSNSLCM